MDTYRYPVYSSILSYTAYRPNIDSNRVYISSLPSGQGTHRVLVPQECIPKGYTRYRILLKEYPRDTLLKECIPNCIPKGYTVGVYTIKVYTPIWNGYLKGIRSREG